MLLSLPIRDCGVPRNFYYYSVGDRKASTENESNNNIANDEHTVSQKGDHDDVRNMEKISQTSPPIVDVLINSAKNKIS
jgi:hypothetical protein